MFKTPCSKDCKWIETKFEANANTYTQGAKPKLPKKWSCEISKTETASPVPVDAGRTVHKMECTYLCGNRFLDIVEDPADPNRKEECDIGDWAFHKLNSVDGYTKFTGAYASPTWGAKTAAEVATWIADTSDPKTNTDLSLGCTQDCMAYRDADSAFKFSDTSYESKGTDRCGDGIMDGKLENLPKTDGTGTITLRADVQLTCNEDANGDFWRTCQITGRTPYWTTEYSGRMLEEQCDNGGDTDHGCDRLC